MDSSIAATLTVRCHDRGDHWAVETVETGIFTYGETREKALSRNQEANLFLLKGYKGKEEEFLQQNGIPYTKKPKGEGLALQFRNPPF